ncbi:PLC-like phosphodiesterase [Kalaharituber pfeilii]|nr:PLC-like phosphodiesterase [Kalaharituber pfeilii]
MSTAAPTALAVGGGRPSALHPVPLRPTSAHLLGAFRAVWATLSPSDKPVATDPDFVHFLQNTQHESPEHIPRILAALGSPRSVDFDVFAAYLCSPHADALAVPDRSAKDTGHPLTSYFISSSHNTYLVGHQLYGDSTTQGYVNVLRRGCRCIEIDVWDGPDGRPQVFHGYTLTKEISFKSVCKAIREHAFWDDQAQGGERCDGPVVISLECHAGHPQQEEMVRTMKKVWEGVLVERPVCGAGSVHDVDRVPTLAELTRKILVKTKYLPPDGPLQQHAPPSRTSTASAPAESSTDSDTDSELEELSRLASHTKPKKPKVTRALADLAIYLSASHFTSFLAPTPLETRPTHVFSFSERVFQKHLASYPQQVVEHNLRHFMRVYPFGLRFSSSNADPTVFWRKGVQLVALNWQKCDEGMMLNEAMFAGEGGYVLKPPHMRPGPNGAPRLLHPPKRRSTWTSRPAGFEPYVKVEVYLDTLEPGEEIKGRTKKAKNKGIDATWDPKPKSLRKSLFRATAGEEDPDVVAGQEPTQKKSKRIGEVVKFRGLKGVTTDDGMLSFVRIKVNDEEFGKDDLAAWACFRLDRLRRGWRVVRMYDNKGRRTGGVLLVRIGWKLN